MRLDKNLTPYKMGLKWNIISSFIVSTGLYVILCLISIIIFKIPLEILIEILIKETSTLFVLMYLSCFSMNFFLDLCLTLDEKKKKKKDEHSDNQPQSV